MKKKQREKKSRIKRVLNQNKNKAFNIKSAFILPFKKKRKKRNEVPVPEDDICVHSPVHNGSGMGRSDDVPELPDRQLRLVRVVVSASRV